MLVSCTQEFSKIDSITAASPRSSLHGRIIRVTGLEEAETFAFFHEAQIMIGCAGTVTPDNTYHRQGNTMFQVDIITLFIMQQSEFQFIRILYMGT